MTAPANVIGSPCPREGEEQSRQYRGGSLLDELVTKRRYLTLWRALALQDNVVRALVRIVTSPGGGVGGVTANAPQPCLPSSSSSSLGPACTSSGSQVSAVTVVYCHSIGPSVRTSLMDRREQ